MATSSKTRTVTKSSKSKAAHSFKARGKAKHAERMAKSDPMDFIISDLRYYIDQQTKIIHTDKDPNEKPSTRESELHPSSYPYCGLRHAYRLLTGIKKEPLDFYGEYYTSLGTMKHELMQKYLGRGKKILGDWKCLDCSHRLKLTTYRKCPKCRSVRVMYEEIGIKFGKYTHGHIDGVVQINGKWYVIDYKTTSTKKNDLHRKTGNVYPYGYNVAQISSYVPYLEECYDIEIAGWILIYVTRDSSFRDYVMVGAEMDKKAKKAKLEQLIRYDEHFGKVMKLKADLQLKYFKRLVLEKPCESLAQYKKEMHNYDWCELAKSGACFDESKLRIVLSNLVNKKQGRPALIAEL